MPWSRIFPSFVLSFTILLACSFHKERELLNDPERIIANYDHIGIVVSNLERSITWYTTVLLLKQSGNIYNVHAADSTLLWKTAKVLFKLHGDDTARIAQLRSATGLNIELFQFQGRDSVRTRRNGSNSGIVHFCIIVKEFDQLIKRLDSLGLKPIIFNSSNPKRRVTFYEDPDGNAIEFASAVWQ